MLRHFRSKKINNEFIILTYICILFSVLSGCRKISEDNVNLTDISSETFVSNIETENEISNEYIDGTMGTSDNTSAFTIGQDITSNPESLQPESPEEEITFPESQTETANKETRVPETSGVLQSEATKPAETSAPAVTSVPAVTSAVTSETDPMTLLASANFPPGANSYKPLNYKEQKGFWITYLEFGNILKNKSKTQFTDSIGKYFDNIKNIGFNTVYVQIRAFGDAYYDSKLFPATDNFDGVIGTSYRFDALEVMINEAHNRGISVHAWVNPLRLMTDSQIKTLSGSYQVKKWYDNDKYKGTYIVKSGDRWYLNPAYPDVQSHIAEGVAEIVSGYNVDGIQIDDYFYPTTDAGFDKSAYTSAGTNLSLSKWRIDNVNTMVKRLYRAAHDANPDILFGISPQGSIENNYDELYADVKTWCSASGYCDYILPQVYFGFENMALPFNKTIIEWQNMVTNSNVKLVIGLSAYKIGAVDNYAGYASNAKNEWTNNSDVISRQIKQSKTLDKYGGVAIYRYDSLFNPSSGVSAQVEKELKNIEKLNT